jgi:CMP-N-acetylneuraminate monooxygenase
MESKKIYLPFGQLPTQMSVIHLNRQNYFFNQIDNKPFLLSSVCPHMGNEVLLDENGKLHCPVHGWEFNSEGKCSNVSNRQLEKHLIEKDDNGFFITINERLESIKHLDHEIVLTEKVSIKLIAHACLEIIVGNELIYTDPWFKGPAFLGAWYPYPKPHTKNINKNPKAIIITHEHSDHLHPETLKCFDKDTLILFPDFPNKRISQILELNGFYNYKALTFGCNFKVSPQIEITCFEPESIWNDSILYFNLAGLRWLNLNDAGLNQKLTKKLNGVDLVSSTFSFGASGFPLTWTNFSIDQKIEMMQKSNLGRIEQIKTAMNLYKASYFLPFASHFCFWHKSHMDFLEIAQRNSVDTIKLAFENEEKFEVIDLLPGESWDVEQEKIYYIYKDRSVFYDKQNIKKFINSIWSEDNFYRQSPEITTEKVGHEEIQNYFLRLNRTPEIIFCENVTVVFHITDFNYNLNSYSFTIKVHDGKLSFFEDELKEKINLWVRIPEKILASVVLNNLSWDEAFIGYWCRFFREENIYHTGFWRLLQAPYYQKSAPNLYTKDLVGVENNIAGLINGKSGKQIELVLNRYGLYCGACHKSISETIRQAAAYHGIGESETNRLIKEINTIIVSES